MEWIAANFDVILSISTAGVVAAAWLWLRYHGNQDRLYADVKELLRDALEFLRVWAGDRLDEVTQDDVWDVANGFYDRYILGTSLAHFITPAQFRELLWEMFERIRGRELAVTMRVIGDK